MRRRLKTSRDRNVFFRELLDGGLDLRFFRFFIAEIIAHSGAFSERANGLKEGNSVKRLR
jgi:hypothetical protein